LKKENFMAYKPDSFAQLTPCLAVQDGGKSIDFYKKAFGFSVLEDIVRDEAGKVQYATLKRGESTLMIFPEGSFDSTSQAPKTSGLEPAVSLYMYVPDVDAFFENALRSGAKELLAPHDAFWGDRFCKLADLDGHVWGFATYTG